MAKIVIVDDSVENRAFVTALLAQAGHEVFEADGGDEGIDLVRAQRPDLVIVDLYMPGMNGTQMIKHLRSSDEFAEVAIALHTATEVDGLLKDFMTLHGVRHVIPKPCQPSEFIRIVGDALTKT